MKLEAHYQDRRRGTWVIFFVWEMLEFCLCSDMISGVLVFFWLHNVAGSWVCCCCSMKLWVFIRTPPPSSLIHLGAWVDLKKLCHRVYDFTYATFFD